MFELSRRVFKYAYFQICIRNFMRYLDVDKFFLDDRPTIFIFNFSACKVW